jgi:hypothetical protein
MERQYGGKSSKSEATLWGVILKGQVLCGGCTHQLDGRCNLNLPACCLQIVCRNMEQLLATVCSAQFKQQVALLGLAIQTGQLDLRTTFGLDAKVG